jgi:hypothetical protein
LQKSNCNTAFQQNAPHQHEELFKDKSHQNHTQRHCEHQNRDSVHTVHHTQVQVRFTALLFAESKVGQDFFEDHNEQT